jgi:hypothetical protein
MEFIIEEIQFGRLRLVLSILEKQGFSVFITAKDEDNRRVWKTPLLDASGSVNIYPDSAIAVAEAKKKVSCLQTAAL